MSHFNLSLGDYGALAALVVGAVVGQSAINYYQIQASEARVLGEFRLQAQTETSARSELTKNFDAMTASVKEVVKSGMEARSDEVMLSMSKWMGPNDTVTIKLANMPLNGFVYNRFVNLASAQGSNGSIYTLGNNAFGSVTIERLDDGPAIELRDIFESASASDIEDVQVLFYLNPDEMSTSDDLKVRGLNLQIEALQKILDEIQR